MAPDTPTAASLAAKLREEIRADLSSRLDFRRGGAAVVPPANVRATAVPKVIPSADGRPALTLPEGKPLPPLTLPSCLKPGLTVTYSTGDSVRGGAGLMGNAAGLGYTNANVNFVSPTLVTFDVRRFYIAEPRQSLALSIGSAAVVGDEVSAGIYWIHPALLALVSADGAPKQADGVTVDRVPFESEGTHFNAVRISTGDKPDKGDPNPKPAPNRGDVQRTVYDLETGLLLALTITSAAGATTSSVIATYLRRREQQIPWAQGAVPDWVGTTRALIFQGTNTILLAGTSLPQAVTLSIDLETLGPGVVLARAVSETNTGGAYPEARSTWDMVCAAAMLYPLWISPASLSALQPNQVLDDDPVTRFRMTFAGSDRGYAMISERGPLEHTTYYYDLTTGIVSGFRGQRPFGDGGGQMQTEAWLREQR